MAGDFPKAAEKGVRSWSEKNLPQQGKQDRLGNSEELQKMRSTGLYLYKFRERNSMLE